MKSCKRMRLVLCLLSMLAHQQASAQAVLAPVENYVVNRAVAGIIANRIAVAEGVAANDAVWLSTKAANDSVYKATMSAVSSQMTAVNVAATVAGGALAIAGAPVWLTIAAGLGITAAGAYYLSTDASQKVSVLQSGSSVVIQSQSVPQKPSYTTPAVATPSTAAMRSDGAIAAAAGLIVYRTSCDTAECLTYPALPANFTSTSPYTLACGNGQYLVVAYTLSEINSYLQAWYKEQATFNKYQYDNNINNSWDTTSLTNVSVIPKSGVDGYSIYISGVTTTHTRPVVASDGTVTVPDQNKSVSFTKNGGWTVLNSAQPKTYTNLTDAYPVLSDAQKAIPVPATQLANIANEAWRRAAQQSGYQGLPYSATQPITSSDVATWQAANPTAMPTLGDMLRPAQNQTTDTNGVPISLTVTTGTNTGSNTGTTTNPGTSTGTSTNPNAQVNLGPDPGVPDPTLEDTPDAATILSPLTSLFPELRSFQTPGHGAECPKPQFEVFGRTLVMDAQCTIAEQHRAAIGALMLAVWMLVGLFILLSA